MIDIKGLDKAEVLLALWNASRMQGMSFLGFSGPLTLSKAVECVEQARHTGMSGKEEIYFDYLNGKVMKIDIAPDEIDPRLYDRDNGEGAAQRAIDNLRLAKCFNENGEAKFSDLMKEIEAERARGLAESSIKPEDDDTTVIVAKCNLTDEEKRALILDHFKKPEDC